MTPSAVAPTARCIAFAGLLAPELIAQSRQAQSRPDGSESK